MKVKAVRLNRSQTSKLYNRGKLRRSRRSKLRLSPSLPRQGKMANSSSGKIRVQIGHQPQLGRGDGALQQGPDPRPSILRSGIGVVCTTFQDARVDACPHRHNRRWKCGRSTAYPARRERCAQYSIFGAAAIPGALPVKKATPPVWAVEFTAEIHAHEKGPPTCVDSPISDKALCPINPISQRPNPAADAPCGARVDFLVSRRQMSEPDQKPRYW